ncbi:jg569, partial [Pararge aegeria aegeria]
EKMTDEKGEQLCTWRRRPPKPSLKFTTNSHHKGLVLPIPYILQYQHNSHSS